MKSAWIDHGNLLIMQRTEGNIKGRDANEAYT